MPYYQKVYTSDSLALIGEYTKGFKILDSLFKQYEPLNNEPYYEYSTYVKLSYLSQNTDNLDLKVIKLIRDFGYDKEWVGTDSTRIMYKIFRLSQISDADYQTYRNKYLSKIDIGLRNIILEMMKYDQMYRTGDNDIGMYKLLDSIDQRNQSILIKMFNNNIYPNESIIGNASIDNNDIYLTGLLLHTKDSIRFNYFLPKIENFIKEGRCPPVMFANMVDQYHLYNDEEQVYGTYNLNRIKEEQYKIFNEKRNKIGLPSIQNELMRIKNIVKFISM